MNNSVVNNSKECNHKIRDNAYGVTWCIKCGRLMTKPCGKQLTKEEAIAFNCLFDKSGRQI